MNSKHLQPKYTCQAYYVYESKFATQTTKNQLS